MAERLCQGCERTIGGGADECCIFAKLSQWGLGNPNRVNDIKRKDADIPGDTIADLKTDKNGLSVWMTPDLDDKNVMPLITAIAMNRDKIQKVSYVVMDKDELSDIEIQANEVPGLAPGVVDNDLLARHHDFQDIDYTRIGKLANYILINQQQESVYSQ